MYFNIHNYKHFYSGCQSSYMELESSDDVIRNDARTCVPLLISNAPLQANIPYSTTQQTVPKERQKSTEGN